MRKSHKPLDVVAQIPHPLRDLAMPSELILIHMRIKPVTVQVPDGAGSCIIID